MEKEKSLNFHQAEEPEQLPKKASDLEIALFLTSHINNPCEVEVEPGVKENIRDFYIREAKNLLPKITDPWAKKILELKIQEYEKQTPLFNHLKI
jgi:hypothetical protein